MKISEDNRIDQQRLENESILVGEGGVVAVIGCELVNCTLTISNKLLSIYRCRLSNCTIIQKNLLKNVHAFGNHYEGCTFKGKFLGVDFGRNPWIDPITKAYDQLGQLIDCDFTQATLDMCRFFGVDVHRQKFAPWPQFVVPYERELAASKLERNWPGQFARFLSLSKDEDPALSAITGTVDYFAHNKKKNRGFGLTEEELRQALLDVGGVLM